MSIHLPNDPANDDNDNEEDASPDPIDIHPDPPEEDDSGGGGGGLDPGDIHPDPPEPPEDDGGGGSSGPDPIDIHPDDPEPDDGGGGGGSDPKPEPEEYTPPPADEQGYVVYDPDENKVLGSGDTEEEAAYEAVETQSRKAREQDAQLRFNEGLPFDVSDDAIEQRRRQELQQQSEKLQNYKKNYDKAISNLPDAERIDIRGTKLENQFDDSVVDRSKVKSYFRERKKEAAQQAEKLQSQKEEVEFELSQVDRPTMDASSDPNEPVTGLNNYSESQEYDPVTNFLVGAQRNSQANIREGYERVQEASEEQRDLNPSPYNPVSLVSASAAGLSTAVTEAGNLFRPNKQAQPLSAETASEAKEKKEEFEDTALTTVGVPIKESGGLARMVSGGIFGTAAGTLGEGTSQVSQLTKDEDDENDRFDSELSGPDFLRQGVLENIVQTGEQVAREPGQAVFASGLTGSAGATAGTAARSLRGTADPEFDVEVEQGQPIGRSDAMKTKIDEQGNVVSTQEIDRAGQVAAVDRTGGQVDFTSEQPFLTARARNLETGDEQFYAGQVTSKGKINNEEASGLAQVETVNINRGNPENPQVGLYDFKTNVERNTEQELFRVQDGETVRGIQSFSQVEGEVGGEPLVARTGRVGEQRGSMGEAFIARTESRGIGRDSTVETRGAVFNEEFIDPDVQKTINFGDDSNRGLGDLSEEELRELAETGRDIYGKPDADSQRPDDAAPVDTDTDGGDSRTTAQQPDEKSQPVEQAQAAELQAFEREVEQAAKAQAEAEPKTGLFEETSTKTGAAAGATTEMAVQNSPLEPEETFTRAPVADRLTRQVETETTQTEGGFSTFTTSTVQRPEPEPPKGLEEVTDVSPVFVRDSTQVGDTDTSQQPMLTASSLGTGLQQETTPEENEIMRPLDDEADALTRREIPAFREEVRPDQAETPFLEPDTRPVGRSQTLPPTPSPGLGLEGPPGQRSRDREGSGMNFTPNLFQESGEQGQPFSNQFTPDLTGQLFGGGVDDGPVTGLERRSPEKEEDEENLPSTGL